MMEEMVGMVEEGGFVVQTAVLTGGIVAATMVARAVWGWWGGGGPVMVGAVNWPREAVQYARVPKERVFTPENVPSGLLGRHNTKKGTWGRIVVVQGEVEYTVLEPKESVFVLQPGTVGIVEPQVYHSVKLLTPDTQFFVEFWRIE